jgi:hypothetical protein
LCKVRVVTLEEIFPPGTFCGDVLLLLDREKTDEDRYQAARRLATKHLTWRSVYGSSLGLQQRWERVRPAFEAYCREHELSYDQGWEQLVTQIICDLILSLPDDVTLNELRWYLTLELRKELERELLGRTADQLGPIDSAERIVAAEDVPDGLADVRLNVWLLLRQLDPLDRELLVDVFLHERSYSELAEKHAVSEKTIRRRVANALQWLRAKAVLAPGRNLSKNRLLRRYIEGTPRTPAIEAGVRSLKGRCTMLVVKVSRFRPGQLEPEAWWPRATRSFAGVLALIRERLRKEVQDEPMTKLSGRSQTDD